MTDHTTYYLDGFVSDPNASLGMKEARGRYLALSGMRAYILNHVIMAEDLIKSNNINYNNELLKLIAKNYRHISSHPPVNFIQAIQLQWFIMQFADYDSFGRYDQYMYPFYKRIWMKAK